MILHEMDWARAEQMSQDEALNTDVVCLLYDITDPASFKYVADIYMVSYWIVLVFLYFTQMYVDIIIRVHFKKF